MNKVLAHWNQLPGEDAVEEILPCCGSVSWARRLVARRPIEDEQSLASGSDEIWNGLTTDDWMEAFSKHPRIGERKVAESVGALSAAWSAQEQSSVVTAEQEVQFALTEENRAYEHRFGRVFIVCATGRSANELLAILRRRLGNDEATELREAAEEQRKITNIRLRKWLLS